MVNSIWDLITLVVLSRKTGVSWAEAQGLYLATPAVHRVEQ
jgi:hypothetical protein